MEGFWSALAGFAFFAWVGDTSEHHKLYRIFNAPPGLGISDVLEGMANMDFMRMLFKGAVGGVLTMIFYALLHSLTEGEGAVLSDVEYTVFSVLFAWIVWKFFAAEIIYDAVIRKEEMEYEHPGNP